MKAQGINDKIQIKLEILQKEKNEIESIKYWYTHDLQRMRMDEIKDEIRDLVNELVSE